VELDEVLRRAAASPGRVIVLTGAGVSAESGIPTFRGAEGYWTVGSRHFRPMEMATFAAFERQPGEVWAWYLYRRGVCHAAQPNKAHLALVNLEERLGDRFLLLTQNVDGLHFRAGSSHERTLQVHGNLDSMRCSGECTLDIVRVPERFGARPGGEPLTDEEIAVLTCGRCGAWMRPHVLWFDETYDELRYHFETALQAASDAALLVVVGTSGTTTLPVLAASVATGRGTPFIDVDPEPNTFADLAIMCPVGAFVQGRATEVLPDLAARIGELFTTPKDGVGV
jgi:NAD-dependent protein deacetylase/lipoamidase